MNATTQSDQQALAVFAHELRGPLASILFAARSMNEDSGDESTCREMGMIVERQGRYLARMIEDALEICRGSCDKLRLHKEWFDLNAAIASAIESVAPLLVGRGHRLSVSLPLDRLSITADAVRVQQVIVNLLTNAAKYTEPGGFIRITLEANGDAVEVQVQDNGIGIPRASLPRIFDLFEQVGEPRVDHVSGLGIGLAVVKSIVELHGGSVRAHSDGVGTGARFVVRLPGPILRMREGRADERASSQPCHRTGYPEASFMGDA